MASTTWPLQPHEFQPNSFAPYDLVPTSWAQRPPQQHVQYIPEQPAPRIHAPEARRPILNDQVSVVLLSCLWIALTDGRHSDLRCCCCRRRLRGALNVDGDPASRRGGLTLPVRRKATDVQAARH